MSVISIRERGITSSSPVVAIDGQEYPLANPITPPFDEKAEAQLEWYFEEHLRFPFTNQVRAQTAATSIGRYGETLFEQLFGDRRAYGRYQTALQAGIAQLAFEIAGSPEFQRLHWEALKDPDLPQPFALQAPFVRRNLTPRTLEAKVRASPTLNVLVVTARPGAGRDVGYRTISRPLVDSLRQAGTPVAVDIRRPGSYAALVAHLEALQDSQGAGYYHVIHFDVHGGLLTFSQFDALEKKLETSHYTFQPQRYGRGKLAPYPGVKAFLFLESGAPGLADPVEATELAKLLLTHQIPIAILNACQSGKQVGASETSLGSQLMSAGMQMVLAMGYSVTVSAAEIMMGRLYQQLFQGGDLAAAIRRARLELSNRKARRAYFNQTIELEDWLLPVVYQNPPGTFDANVYELPGLDAEAATTLADRILARHHATGYRRDPAMQQDLQRLITLLDGHPLALEVVLGNLAKQTPAAVLAALQSGDVGVDTPPQPSPDRGGSSGLVDATSVPPPVWGRLGGGQEDKTKSIVACIDYSHSNLSPDAQHLLLCLAPFTGVINQEWLPQYTEQLKAQPALAHLPFHRWDEVLTEAINWGLLTPDGQLSIYLRVQPIFPYFLQTRLQEQTELSHAIENAFQQHYDDLSHALYQLMESKEAKKRQLGQILTRFEYENIHQALIVALQKQKSIMKSYGALAKYLDSIRDLDRGLSLDENVMASIGDYTSEQLSGQPGVELAVVIDDIAKRKLLTQQYVQAKAAYERVLTLFQQNTGFTEEKCQKLCAGVYQQLGSVVYEQRQWAQAEQYYQQALAIKIKYNDHYSQASTYHGLGMVAQAQQQWAQAEQYYQQALALFIEYNDRYNQAGTYHHLGSVAYEQQQWIQAEKHYQQAFALFVEYNDRYNQACVYHQLGRVVQAQQQWVQAEQYYQQALALFIDYNDRYNQARTYHELGMVVQALRQWTQAEQYYQQAFALFIEYNDRYSQASTYHQLGMVAEEQKEWQQAYDYFMCALAIFIEFNDEYSFSVVQNSLRRLWQAHPSENVLAVLAQALSMTVEEAQSWIN